MSGTAAARRDDFDREFARDVMAGLSQPQKSIPCTWLYDRRGSELFEEITALPEYYPSRSELQILKERLPAFGERFGRHASVIEMGAGSSRKTRLLLSALRAPYAYLPVDISAEFLFEAVALLQGEFPEVRCTPLVVDFTAPGALQKAALRLAPVGPSLGFFPGSTIGNFAPEQATVLLAQLGRALGAGATLIIGVDSTADPGLLLPAYDDAQGVTAQFNLNLLVRINRELGGTFRIENFAHEARFDAARERVEMHLVSRLTQRVCVLGTTFVFEAGETIHTENSHKYSRERFLGLARAAGWISSDVWTAPHCGFEVHRLSRAVSKPQSIAQGD